MSIFLSKISAFTIHLVFFGNVGLKKSEGRMLVCWFFQLDSRKPWVGMKYISEQRICPCFRSRLTGEKKRSSRGWTQSALTHLIILCFPHSCPWQYCSKSCWHSSCCPGSSRQQPPLFKLLVKVISESLQLPPRTFFNSLMMRAYTCHQTKIEEWKIIHLFFWPPPMLSLF